MLILIAGATGNIGGELIASSLSRGHEVRVLARNPKKLDRSVRSRLESFVPSENYYDIPALDKACAGVDAIICAYAPLPVLQLEGQLLLLRAAERAGVKRFVCDSWNCDWERLPLGTHESYDNLISFRTQAEMSSPIKPLYIFTGVLAEVLFSFSKMGDFSPKNHGVWDPVKKMANTWGTGDEPYHITTLRDAAEYTIEIVQHQHAEDGGSYSVCSYMHSMNEVVEMYRRVQGRDASVKINGSIEDLRKIALNARANGSKQRFWEYIGYFYNLHTLDQTWIVKDLANDRFPAVRPISLEDFLKQHPEV